MTSQDLLEQTNRKLRFPPFQKLHLLILNKIKMLNDSCIWVIMCSKKKILAVESISNWQNPYSLVKRSSLVNTFFFWKTFVHSCPNFLQNESSQFSQIYLPPEKLRQMFTFSILQNFNLWIIKFTVTIFPHIVSAETILFLI